ncbi:ribbon-helix-helix protein, CopG family [Nitrospirillum sp. BR 11164]|uniref:CopG family ribbon-helix-helix protein n=1 Tax=Nitrospirillum sp. BR 11164 TaxID=3104324 RepID=UPI002AFED49E|nr:ribbon-helix-helix protein, CopG family [Nitrospirillum sp. BR 11164]MEA1651591.1 ribbon-helix-helix protein, CopG family [Nitrospirillum sp. BR 11164]
MASQNFSIRTEPAILAELDKLAEAQNRSRNFVVNEAIERYLAEERQWTAQVQAGLAAAAAGDFATDAEMDALFEKFEAEADR